MSAFTPLALVDRSHSI